MAVSLTSYQQKYDAFHRTITDNSTKSPCEQLKEFRMLVVDLTQERSTYWPRPCFRDWPCIWDQHRSNIDKLKERMAPIEKDLERECRIHSQAKATMERLQPVMDQIGGNLKAHNSSGSVAAGGDVVFNLHLSVPPIDRV